MWLIRRIKSFDTYRNIKKNHNECTAPYDDNFFFHFEFFLVSNKEAVNSMIILSMKMFIIYDY